MGIFESLETSFSFTYEKLQQPYTWAGTSKSKNKINAFMIESNHTDKLV